MPLLDRLKHGWNAFTRSEEDRTRRFDYGPSTSSIRPARTRFSAAIDRSILASIINRIAIDVASVEINHIKTDDDGRFSELVKSGLQNCLTTEANLDQTGRVFRQEAAETLLNRGHIAIVPVETDGGDPFLSESYDVRQLRVGTVVEWYPQFVRVDVYNQKTGLHEEMTLPKKLVVVVENPLYAVMNEPNGTLQRLLRKLGMLDSIDEQSSNGKLDMIIQLPYVIKTDAKQEQAEKRRNAIETQLRESKYGIAYTDGTEKITQLNRPIENGMLDQIKLLTEQLYAEMGLTAGVFNGTASDSEMTNYYNRTVEPILSAISDEIKRKFLSRTARTQNQTIAFYRDPFKLMAISQIADIADKLTRNEIMSSNEFRGKIGMKPLDDPKADMAINSNMPQAVTGALGPDGAPVADETTDTSEPDPDFNSALDELESELDGIFSDGG